MINISVKLHQNVAEAYPFDVLDAVDDALIETIWHELDMQLPRERVSCVVSEVALGFEDATVKTFLPILVHRRALEWLRQEIDERALTDGLSLDEQQ